MQFTNILIALTSLASLAAAAPQPATTNDLAARQSALDTVTSVLRDARTGSMEQIEQGGGRGRKLGSASCSSACQQCQTGAVTKAVGEIGVCGSAVLAVEVATAGIATILEVAGFIACETAVIGELNGAEANCGSLP